MSAGEHRLLERKTIFEGKVVRLFLDRVRLPDGEEAEREVVSHWGAVGVVPLTAEGDVLLVRQYRHATGEDLLEIPAGKLLPGEDPIQCAVRELEEETGMRAERWYRLASFYTSPGFSDEMLHLFMAAELREGVFNPDEGEFLEIVSMSLERGLALVAEGEVKDSKTVAGLALAYLHLHGGFRGTPLGD